MAGAPWAVLWLLPVVTTQTLQLRSCNCAMAAPAVTAHRASSADSSLSVEEKEARFCILTYYFVPSFSSIWNGCSYNVILQSGWVSDSCSLRHRKKILCSCLLELWGTSGNVSTISFKCELDHFTYFNYCICLEMEITFHATLQTFLSKLLE